MQEIRETIRKNRELRETLDRLTGPESLALHEAFENRRIEAFDRQTKRTEQGIESTTIIKETRNFRRNDPCPCGSGVKYKKCCGSRMATNDKRIKK